MGRHVVFSVRATCSRQCVDLTASRLRSLKSAKTNPKAGERFSLQPRLASWFGCGRASHQLCEVNPKAKALEPSMPMSDKVRTPLGVAHFALVSRNTQRNHFLLSSCFLRAFAPSCLCRHDG